MTKKGRVSMKIHFATRLLVSAMLLLMSMALYGCTPKETEMNGMKYYVDHGVLTIRGEGVMPDSSSVSSPNADPEKAVEYEWKSEEPVSKIVLKGGITHIGAGVFMLFSDVTEAEMPDTVVSIRDGAFSLCGSLMEIKLSENLEEIGMSSFYGCRSLKLVELPDGLRTIGHAAFAGSAIQEINIPSSVVDMSENVFGGCPELKSVSVSTQNQRYYSVDGVLFDDKTRTLLMYPPSRKGESYEVPEGIKRIAMNAFWGCELKTILLPESVTEIGRFAFNKSDIETIYYRGTMEQWGHINIENENENIQMMSVVFTE